MGSQVDEKDYIGLDPPQEDRAKEGAEPASQDGNQRQSYPDQNDPNSRTEDRTRAEHQEPVQQQEVDEDKVPEWKAMPQIPERWKPLPLFLIRNVPVKDSVTEEDLKALVEGVPNIKVKSVNFDDRPNERVVGRRSALVRLQLPPLPSEQEQQQEEGGKGSSEAKKRKLSGLEPAKDGDAVQVAAWAVNLLKHHSPPLEAEGEALTFETSSVQVQLYIGNLTAEWQEDEAFANAMAAYGKLERAFVMRNAAGLSKGYGFVEFSHPASALACKQAMDEIERNMRPDPRKPKEKASAQDKAAGSGTAVDESNGEGQMRGQALKVAGWPEGNSRLVKLLRAEWATMRNLDVLFSRVLYVANLRTNEGSQQQLKEIFEAYGKIAEVTVPINKATMATKGFAFVAFANGLAADRAYRALEKSGSEEIGGALVSFANSAKANDMQSRSAGGSARSLPTGGRTGGRGPPSGVPSSRFGRGVGPPGRMPLGFPGRGMGPGPGLEEDLLLQQQQQLHMQAGMAAQAQMARQMELRMQQQMQAQQAQMQAQLRQAQLQVQQVQQQAQQLQRQAAQAQAKAAAEAEARKRAEEEARRAAVPRLDAVKRGSAHYAGSYSATPEARGSAAAFGGPGGGYGSLSPAKHSALSSYGHGPAGASAGYGAASSQGYGSQDYGASASGGYGEGYGSQGYGAHDYGYGGHGEYGSSGTAGYGQHGGGYEGQDAYGQGGYSQHSYPGYGEGRPSVAETAYGSAHNYGTASYGQAEGYGAAESYEQQGAYAEYGQQSGGVQKRPNPYQQVGYGGGYGVGAYGAGSYAGQGGREYGKRQRF